MEKNDDDNKRILDNKYIIEHRVGSGGEGVAYLVSEKEHPYSEKKFIAKIIEFDGNEDEEEYEIDEEIENVINQKINIFNKIASIIPPSPYIIGCIEQNKGKIMKDNILIKNRNYFIFEYAPKGDLWRIIYLTEGFGERYSKLIFKKILLGVQTLHKNKIYHLDLKIENIILDENYNPKICDFGLATDNQDFLTDKVGTKNYKPPQMFEEEIKYKGEKADIFSLGCILFALVATGPWFTEADKNNEIYKFIVSKNIDAFFRKLVSNIKGIQSLSEAFKQLYIKMIAYEEKDRPNNIQEILDDKWFNEINNLNEEKQKELENEIKTEFIKKEEKMKEILEIYPDTFEKYETFQSDNRGLTDDIEEIIFPEDLEPKRKKFNFYTDYYIKIKGKLDYYTFMNLFIDKIKKQFEEQKINCSVGKYKGKYKCDLIFERMKDDEEENGKENEKEEDNCTIQLKLYQSGDEEFALRFLRKEGRLPEYYQKIIEIVKLYKNLF